MSKTAILTAAAAAFLSAGTANGEPVMPGEAKLARALAGRVASKPIDCITLRRARSSRTIDRTANIYEVGGTLYVDRPPSGAELLLASNVLVTKTPTGEICWGEIVQLFDRGARLETGTVILGPFVPYRKVQAQPAVIPELTGY